MNATYPCKETKIEVKCLLLEIMRWIIYTLFLFAFRLVQAQETILAEIFTYDGCSHCMLANRAIQKIENDPALHKDIILLSHHVDYEAQDNFYDSLEHPFSRMRQQEFVKQGVCSGIYTPQLVVNGTLCVPVSNRNQVLRLLNSLSPDTDKTRASISILPVIDGFSVNVDLASSSDTAYTIFIVLVENERVAVPTSGDNTGATLVHRNCLIEAMRFTYRPSFSKSFRFPQAILQNLAHYSALVFLQHNESGRVRFPKLFELHQIR